MNLLAHDMIVDTRNYLRCNFGTKCAKILSFLEEFGKINFKNS